MALSEQERLDMAAYQRLLGELDDEEPSFLKKGAPKPEPAETRPFPRGNTGPDLSGQFKRDIAALPSIDNNPVSNALRKALPDARPGDFGAPRYDDPIAHDPIAQAVITAPLTMGAGALARPLGAIGQGVAEGLIGSVTSGNTTPSGLAIGAGLGTLGRAPGALDGAVTRSAAREPGTVGNAFKDVVRNAITPKGVAWRAAAEGGAHMIGLPPGAVTGTVAGIQGARALGLAADEGLAAAGRAIGVKPYSPGTYAPRPTAPIPGSLSNELAPGLPHPVPRAPLDTGGVPSAVDPDATVAIPRQPMRDIVPPARGEGVDLAAVRARNASLPDDTAALDKTQRIASPAASEKPVSPKMQAYRDNLKLAEDTKFAKGMGLGVDEYRALMARRAARVPQSLQKFQQTGDESTLRKDITDTIFEDDVP